LSTVPAKGIVFPLLLQAVKRKVQYRAYQTLNSQDMFIQLTDHFKKNKFAINIKAIKTIVEYDTGTKIECIKEDGTFLTHFYTTENISEVCEIINNVSDKNNGKVTVYYKESLFK
jgi:hypothetical protein